MKPNPLVALYHLTVPISSTVGRSTGEYAGRSGRARLGCSCNAVLASILRISVTCGPFGPGPARTSSVAPGGMLPWPLRSTKLTCRKASPEPSGQFDEAEALVRVVPLDGRSDGRAGGAVELRTEAAAAGLAKISLSIAHVGILGQANL